MVAVFRELYPMWVAAQGADISAAAPALQNKVFTWIAAGNIDIAFGLRCDPLGAVMIMVVTFVGSMIHIYSTGYMSEDRDYARFFGYLNLFTGSMLILVLGDRRRCSSSAEKASAPAPTC